MMRVMLENVLESYKNILMIKLFAIIYPIQSSMMLDKDLAKHFE